MSKPPPEFRDENGQEQEDVTLSRTRARQGVTFGHMRWVLRISLALAVAGLVAAWLWL